MLDEILGSHTAMMMFLHLQHHGKTYASAVARDFQISLSQIQRQLERFEKAGILVSEKIGKTRVYSYNLKFAATKPFMELVRLSYESLSIAEKAKLFQVRRRPRRPGKPVLGRPGE